MRKAILILLPILIFTACRKRSTADQHKWACVKKDSIVSNIPALNNANYKDSSVKYNDVSEASIKFMINQYTRMDTIYHKNDTLELEYWSMVCDRTDD